MTDAPRLPVTGDPAADALLDRDPFALLLGMLLDQQVPMEWAFSSPLVLRERFGGELDANALAARGEDGVVEAFCAKPAVHRYPAVMARRAYALAQHLVERYGGDTQAMWTTADSGPELLARLKALPGFGDDKARIFLALLAKRFGVQPAGWEQAAGPFADGRRMSVADVDSPDAVKAVRAFKQAQKKAAKAAG